MIHSEALAGKKCARYLSSCTEGRSEESRKGVSGCVKQISMGLTEKALSEGGPDQRKEVF